MQVEVSLTLIGDVPDDLRVGDVLGISGAVTVHSLRSDLVETTAYNQARSYLPTVVEVGVLANSIKFAATREP